MEEPVNRVSHSEERSSSTLSRSQLSKRADERSLEESRHRASPDSVISAAKRFTLSRLAPTKEERWTCTWNMLACWKSPPVASASMIRAPLKDAPTQMAPRKLTRVRLAELRFAPVKR